MTALFFKNRKIFKHPCNTFAAIMEKKLSELQAGEKGVIVSFKNNDLFLKLMEMGCVPGEEVLVDMIAPLGDPISIKVAGYQLSLRVEEADAIIINPCN
jgi:Fe2+ transport system protein FeoA